MPSDCAVKTQWERVKQSGWVPGFPGWLRRHRWVWCCSLRGSWPRKRSVAASTTHRRSRSAHWRSGPTAGFCSSTSSFRPAHHRIRRRAAPRPARCGQASRGRHCSSSALSACCWPRACFRVWTPRRVRRTTASLPRHVQGRPRNRSTRTRLKIAQPGRRQQPPRGAQSWDAPAVVRDREAGLLNGDLRAASGKELLVLTSLDHAFNGR